MGKVVSVGKAVYTAPCSRSPLPHPSSPSFPRRSRGYWLIGADGGVYPFGDARYEGGTGGKPRADPVVAAAATPDGAGYWLVDATGGVMAFGDARNYGSLPSPVTGHVVAIVATTDGEGYWIASQHGRCLQLR